MVKKMKPTLENVTVNNSRQTVYLVKYNGNNIGLISKFRNDRYTTNPWMAFLIDGAATFKPNTRIGVFYETNGKQLAINALINQ